MRARKIILTIAAAAFLAAPTAVFAQNGPGPGDGTGSGGAWGGGQGRHGGDQGRIGNPEGVDGLRFFERMLPRLAEELGLSDEQISEIQAIVDTARQKIEEEGYVEQLKAEREAYRAAHEDPTYFNADDFRAHATIQHEIQTELGVVAGQAKAKAFDVLTPEQRQQLEEMRGKFGHKNLRRSGGRRSSS
jgi:Spy/CpxP family protein refolding chaperone